MPNSIRLGTLTRSMPFKAESQRTAEDGSPVIRIAISSEYPVLRDFGSEILDHTPASCDLSRMRNGAPFCVDHDLREQVGVLENVSLDEDRVLRADVRFSRSQRGQDIHNDIVDGIRKHISVGYAVRKMTLERKSDGPDTYRVTDWLPFEASTVAVPADPTVGVGRSAPDNATDVEIVCEEAEPTEERATVITTDVVTVSESTETVTLDDNGALVSDEYTTTSTTTVATTYETTPPEAIQPEAEPATETETDTDNATRNVPLMTVASTNSPSTTLESHRMETINVADPIVLTEKESRQYSIANAIEGIVSGKRSGLEFEISEEIAKKLGRTTEGFYIPTSYRAMTSNTSTAGAELVFTTEGDFIDALRAKTVCASLGARMVPISQKVSYPRGTNTSSAQWIAENGTGATAQDLSFDSVTIDPKQLIAQAGFSRKLLQLSSFAVEGLVRDAFVKDFAVALDKAVCQGSGSTQPGGIYYNANVNVVSGTSGSLATFAHMVSAETLVLEQNADGGSMAYIVTPGLSGKLKQTLKNPSGTDSGFVLQNGEINGYKAVVCNNLPWTTTLNHTAIFGDWSKVVMADGGAIEVIVDKLTYANVGNIVVTGQWLADVAILQPKAFSVIKQVKTA